MPMIVAEELDADWRAVHVRQAPAHEDRYGRQSVGGSASVRTSWDPLRQAGATARAMLVSAAAAQWDVDHTTCRTENSTVIHDASNRRLTYGELAEAAAARPVPENPALKDPSEYRIIGRSTPRTDTPLKVNGTAEFGMDVRIPGMLYATIARSPTFVGRLTGYNADAARAVEGVRDVVELENGVAVVADNTWAAIKGRRALEPQWDPGDAATLTSARISEMFRERLQTEGAVAQDDGDARGALRSAARRVRAEYEVPYHSHAPLEPGNTTAHVTADRCEVWSPCQVPQSGLRRVATMTGLDADQIRFNVTFLGGGFGRRLETDYVAEAVDLSQRISAPVKVVWEREDDVRHDWYRPASLHILEAGLDANGRPTAWIHRLAASSISESHRPGSVRDGLDRGAVAGAVDIPYAVPNVRVEYGMVNTSVPVGWWRSVFDSQTAFANEVFMDELAHAAGQDPVAYRRQLLADEPRHLGVMELVARESGWGTSLPAGRGRGIAVHRSFGTYAAQVAEVTVASDGAITVDRIVTAIDPGIVINPDTVIAQVQGSIAFALTATLKDAITIDGGAVVQSNFHDYRMLRINEMPEVAVHIVESREHPTGLGEPAVPPVAPAVVNAIYAATGNRLRTLPISTA
jgi:CO/xanthine dehydrogenase Mo-binding subunit